jgi:hypothetical protein
MRNRILMLIGMMLVFGCMAFAETMTGVVSDSMCGAKHSTASAAATKCVKQCEANGAKLVVVSNGKVYTTDDQAKLKGFEGKEVKIDGTVSGDSINITSVASAGGKMMKMKKSS